MLKGVLPLTAALVPLIIAPGILFYFDVTPKVVILLLGVSVALPWFAPRRELRLFYILLAIQAASLILSTIFSSRAGLSVFGSTWRRFGLITQFGLLMFTALAASDLARSRHRLRLYLQFAAAAAIPISLYGIAQYFGIDPWLPKQAYHVGEGPWTIVRPPGTLGYVSYFANYLVLAVFLGAALYSIEDRGWWKKIGAAAAVLGASAIVLSGTRAAILAVLAGAAYLWFSLGMRIRRPILLLAAIALFFVSPAGEMLRNRTRWYSEDLRGGARLLLWRDSLALASRHWLTGAGPETFSSEFPHVQSAALSRAYPGFYHESAHNIFLDALTAQGIIGLLSLLAFIGLGFYAAWAARKSEPVLAAILGACLIAGIVTHQFTVFTTPTALYFYLTVAMLTAVGQVPDLPSRMPRKMRVGPTIISLTLTIFAIRLLIADRTLTEVRTALETHQTTEAAIAYQRARYWGLTADLWYSREMAAAALTATDQRSALQAWQQALESGVRATTTSDDPHNAWYSLATLHARENDFQPTERCLRAAISSSPNWFKPHWMLAQVLQTEGHREEARREATVAADLDGGKNPEVAQTLARIMANKE